MYLWRSHRKTLAFRDSRPDSHYRASQFLDSRSIPPPFFFTCLLITDSVGVFILVIQTESTVWGKRSIDCSFLSLFFIPI